MAQIVANLDGEDGVSPLVERLAAQLSLGAPDRERDLVSQLLEYASAAEQQIAEQRRRIAYLESLSLTDELTGLCNRRGFERFLCQALAAAERHGETGVVGLFDLDGFKGVNDALGHTAGDAVIARVAELLKAQTRSFDNVARFGGDEFAVVLTRCKPLAGARRLRALQASLDRAAVAYDGQTLSVSASLGIQSFDGDSSLDALLLATDRAMYQDKRSRQLAST